MPPIDNGKCSSTSLRIADTPIGEDHLQSTYYGADIVAANYCKLSPPLPPIAGNWQHGWHPSYYTAMTDSPIMILGQSNRPDPHARHFVALESQRAHLAGLGFTNVHAIGLPIVYVPPAAIHRTPGSLLVMPPHSSSHTFYDWHGEDYAEAMDAVRHHFSRIVVCIHQSCWRRGYWVEAFRRRGYEVMRGVVGPGANAYEAQRDLMSQFEYMTTNCSGSHVAYAAYFGCKVSVFGPWPETPVEGSRESPGLGKFSSYDPSINAQAVVAKWFPFLFNSPESAACLKKWADEELGVENRRSPGELADLLGWGPGNRRAFALRAAQGRVHALARRWVPDALKEQVKRRRVKSVAVEQEKARLRTYPALTTGVSGLLGGDVEFLDASSFLAAADEIFVRQVLRFGTGSDSPRVVDCGAGIGLGVLYVKTLFPAARVTAFEPDPTVLEVLANNVSRFGLEDVALRPQAVWTGTSVAAFRTAPGGVGGRLSRSATEPETIHVDAIRLRDLLADSHVDLLKVTVNGAEAELLDDCGDALRNVEHAFVRYQSSIDAAQNIDLVLRALRNAGMRIHIEAVDPAVRPFLERRLRVGTDSLDMVLNIWGYRR